MNPDAALPTFRLAPGTTVAQALPPTQPAVTLASPAREVVTDLALVKASRIAPRASLGQAEAAMIRDGVRMLFVVSDGPAIDGLITTTDLYGERRMRLVHERGLRFDDLAVADVMTPLDALDAVDDGALDQATVGNLVATLARFGRNHLLVVRAAGGEPQRVCGIVSRSQIERQLGRPIDLAEVAESFAEIERALA